MSCSRRSLHHLASVVALLLPAACDNGANMYCLAPYSPAVIVTPEDSSTRANLAAAASGIARSASAIDSLRRVDSVLWGGSQLGTYELTVVHSGYQQWTRSGIRVTQATDCGMPVSVHVTALLHPIP